MAKTTTLRPVEISVADWEGLSAAERLAARELLAMRPQVVAPRVWLEMGEQARLDFLLTSARAPEDCGPEIPVAPARGLCRAYRSRRVVPGAEAGGPRDPLPMEDAGYCGRGEDKPRRTVALADVFDRMAAAARRARKPAPFSPGQIAIARRYRTLVERHEAGGVKLSSLEGRTGGSGRNVDVTDIRLVEAREIEALRRRIGAGAAMVVRRVRPSARGAGASIILDRRLVDAVCLEDQDPSAVLKAHGWAAKGERQNMLRQALSAALDRMQGYR